MLPSHTVDDTRRVLERPSDDASLTDRRGADGTESTGDGVVQPGMTVGRYVVLRRLAAGGMGVVFAAYDPELDRKVALKLLKVVSSGAADGRRGEEARLVRESRSMAKLSHPNVVAIYDVGTFRGSVFMTMELVEGQTLRQWLLAKRHPWREVVRVMLEAGRGLAAAHEAGLVHRDFKPSNVLISDEGRVYVTDFGLARPTRSFGSAVDRDGPSLDPAESLVTGNRFEATGEVTEFGTIVGTPGFMAPEQRTGGCTDARTDQFSFCVSLYLALYGELPFAEVRRGVTPQYTQVREAPKHTKVPAWVRRVVLRGLAVDPAARHASLPELFAALSRDPGRMWRRAGVAVAVLGLAGGGAWAYVRSIERAPMCSEADPRAQALWDETRRAQAETAFASTKRAFAEAAWSRVDERMTAFSSAWNGARRETCEATHVRHEQSQTIFDRRMWCLSQALEQGRAIGDLFAEADFQVVARAPDTLASLPDLQGCMDVERLVREVAPPEDEATRAAVQDLRARMADLEALELVGRYEPALELAQSNIARAKELAYAPVRADGWFQLGRMHVALGDDKAAGDALRRSLYDAERSGMDGLKVDVLHWLVHVEAGDRFSLERAQAWLDMAEATIERIGDTNTLRWATHAERESEMRYVTGDYAAAIVKQREAIERKLAGDATDPSLAANYLNLGSLMSAAGDEAGAIEYQRRGLEKLEEVFGPEHPNVALTLGHLASSYAIAGEHDEALHLEQRAVEVYESSLGAANPATFHAHVALAMTYFRMARFDDADASIAAAFASGAVPPGAEDPRADEAAYTRGWIALGRGNFEEALGFFGRSLSLASRGSYGDASAGVTAPSDGVGEALVALGRPTEAFEIYRNAIEITQQRAPESYGMGYHLMGLGTAQLRSGDAEAAVENLERALALFEPRISDATVLGRTRAALAEALWDQPGRRERAIGLAAQAREDLAIGNARARVDLAPSFRWLDAHAG